MSHYLTLLPIGTVNEELIKEWLIGYLADECLHEGFSLGRGSEEYVPDEVEELEMHGTELLPEMDKEGIAD